MTLTLAAPVIGKAVANTLARKFGGAVVERWTRYRAARFFEGFVETVGAELVTCMQTDEVDTQLTEILADDTKSEMLFDAYRRVCFSKSKTLGPRIIGLLTGQLVHAGRMADSTEERVFEAAESLSDGDFIEFMKTYAEYRKKAEGIKDHNAKHRMSGESVFVRWSEESAWSSSVEIGSFPWEGALGRWSVDLHQIGLVDDCVSHAAEFESAEEGPGISTTVTTTLTFHPGCARLYELSSRALGPESNAGNAQPP